MGEKARILKKREAKQERKKPKRALRYIAAAAAAALASVTTPHFSASQPVRENVAHAEEASVPQPRETPPEEHSDRRATTTTTTAPEEPKVWVGTPESPLPAPAAQEEQRDQPDLNNDVEMTVDTYFTESGAAYISGGVSYREWGSLSTGLMWFPSIAESEVGFAPFGVLRLTPGFERSGILGRSYSAIGGAMLNSELWAFQSFGLGFVQKRGEFELRGAGVFGGALAYPCFDLIYADLRVGMSLDWNDRVLVYGALSFFFAAETAAQTAYVGYYRPEFQALDIGLEIQIREWLLDIQGTYDVIRSGLRVGIERDVWFGNGLTVATFGATVGFASWSDRLMGRNFDLTVIVGADVRFPGRRVNSSGSIEFEHLHGGGVSQAEMDLDNPYVDRTFIDERARRIERDLQGATSMDNLIGRYEGSSFEQALWFSRIIAHRANYLYSYGANEAIGGMRFFDPEVQRIANMTYDEGLGYLGAYLRLLDTPLGLNDMPEYLRQGLGMCPFIHDFAAAYMRGLGFRAITASVNTTTEPHVIMIAMNDQHTVLVDYGDEYRTGPYSFDEALRLYGMARGAMVLRTQLFDDQYIGTFTTSEGRVIIRAMGFNNLRLLFYDFLGLRSRRD